MFEAQSKNRMGLLIWMSHPCWPSFVWQTYDYYLEPTAGYFGAKKASEPLHIQWNPVTDNVEVVNYSGGRAAGLTARVQVLNMDGAVKWEKSATLDSAEDSVAAPDQDGVSGGPDARCISSGWNCGRGGRWFRRTSTGAARRRRTIARCASCRRWRSRRPQRWSAASDRWFLTTTLDNTSSTPALMVRLKAVREKSGDRILPAIYSDGYVALMPGEKRGITTELREADTRGETPRIVVEGFNVK